MTHAERKLIEFAESTGEVAPYTEPTAVGHMTDAERARLEDEWERTMGSDAWDEE